MIVEFIGTPGSGKTTLLPVVSSYLNERGYKANSVLEAARPFAQRTFPGKVAQTILPGQLRRSVLWQIFYYASYFRRQKFQHNHPMLLRTVRNHQAGRPITQYDYDHVMKWFVHLTGYYQFFIDLMQAEDVVIYDEGFVHRVVQLFASENEKPDFSLIAIYLDLIPKPDLVVFTNTPVEICEERVFKRGVWERFEKKGPEATSAFITHASEVVNFSASYLRDRHWNLIEVRNGDGEISAAEETLKVNLSQWL